MIKVQQQRLLIIMSDSFRVVECFHTPTPLFTIYDYTKIAQVVHNHICLRELTNDAKPTFIPIDHQHNTIALLSFSNCLVLGEYTQTRDINLHFYQQNEVHLKISSQLAKRSDQEQNLIIKMYNSSHYIYIVVRRQNDIEIIIVDYSTKLFCGRTFLSGQLTEFKTKNIDSFEHFSVTLRDSQQVIELEVVPGKYEQHSVRVAEKHRWSIKTNTILHCWCREELAIYDGENIKIYNGAKELQAIRERSENLLHMKTTITGFLVVNSKSLRSYKKSVNSFELAFEYSLERTPFDGVQLSPQEDMIAFYSIKQQAIYYSLNYEAQTQSPHKIRGIKWDLIQHKKEGLKVYNSTQATIVMTTNNRISIYSPITYKCFINIQVSIRESSKNNQSQKRLLRSTTIGAYVEKEHGGLQIIESVAIHPLSNVIAVLFKNIIKIYHILYNQLKVFREMNVSNCKEVGYSHSGNIFYAKISGKQGSKVYIYNALNNYEQFQTLSSNKAIELLKFGLHDNLIYGFFANGFYSWSIQSHLKQRNQNNMQFGFEIKGAEITQNETIVWGNRDLVRIDGQGEVEEVKFNKEIAHLTFQNKNIVLMTKQGELYRCKSINHINTVTNTQGFKVPPDSKILSIRFNTILCLNQDANILCLEWGQQQKNAVQLVSIERKKIIRYQQQYLKYEKDLVELQQKFGNQVQALRDEFGMKEMRQRQKFLREIKDKQERYLSLRAQKLRTEVIMQETLEARQQETHIQIKELEKIYQRKLALTTNKLLTSEEITFRNQLLAKENLHSLEKRHSEDIQKIRAEYSSSLKQHLSQNRSKNDLFALKKDYETKLSQLEIQNELLLKKFQSLTQNNILNLKKNVLNLELKYGQVISQKYNLQKQFNDELLQLQTLKDKNDYLSSRLSEELRRSEQLSKECNRVQRIVGEKDLMIVALEKRVQQLQKSNEIFKYRIIEMKNSNDPKEEEILKLKDNMIELEEEYEKITKKAYQHEQTISLLKKDINQTKALLNSSIQKEKKLDKNYGMIIDKIREVTKSPIQQIRRLLLKILDNFENAFSGERVEHNHKRSNSPLEELNRVRQHLQVCLKDVVEAGKKNEKQKDVQISRKNRQNSELLREINDLRVRVRDLEATLKERELELQEIYREGKTSSHQKRSKMPERISTHFESEPSHDVTKNKTRESFFQKSMFKGQWLQKRMKTEEGTRRKKSHYSLARQETNPLYIESKGEEAEQLRRLVQQKETIIKQLINKIHKLS